MCQEVSSMLDMEARHVIEALRSGIPSRAVGQYFSEARPQIMKEIAGRLDQACETGTSDGYVICGKYGEGKTHLLNTVFNMAQSNHMVVSYLSLSKETHMDKLYYLLRSYLNTEDQEEKFSLQADLEGDFIGNGILKKIYKRIFNQAAKYNVSFSKTKHCLDYFAFMSHLFLKLGYNGWVILVDETERMGRPGKKARLNAYGSMAYFLLPKHRMESVFSMFALSASYVEDVIEGKHEFDNLEAVYPDQQEPAKTVLNLLIKSPQLNPLTREEIHQVLVRVQEFHGRAYGWTSDLPVESIAEAAQAGNSGFYTFGLPETKKGKTIDVIAEELFRECQQGCNALRGSLKARYILFLCREILSMRN